MTPSGYNERAMWRDIGTVVQDLRTASYRPHKIARLLGLTAAEAHGVLTPGSPQWANIIMRQNSMVDPTDQEIEAIQAASEPAGAYLESIGKTDLATLEEVEWFTLLEVIITAYSDKLNETT